MTKPPPDKTNPIHGLDKIPIEALLKMEREERGKDLAYIQELEYENEALKTKIKYLEEHPNAMVNELQQKLSIALKGTPSERKALRTEIRREALICNLEGNANKALREANQMKSLIGNLRASNRDLICKLTQANNEIEKLKNNEKDSSNAD